MELGPRPHCAPIALGTLQQALPPSAVLHGDPATPVAGIELDSRLIRLGDVFAALAGHREHGVIHAAEAVANGAAAILTDSEGWRALSADASFGTAVAVLEVPDTRLWLGPLARAVYVGAAGEPLVLGVTGTNGKTTVATMIEAGLQAAGVRTGFIGTTGVRIGAEPVVSTRTTPEATTVHALLSAMAERGVGGVAMEVSSHAMVEHRVGGVRFAVAGFTNLTQDHLDYHETMEQYFEAKASLFTQEHADFAVICVDDDWGRRLAAQVRIPFATVSITGAKADWSVVEAAGRVHEILAPTGERAALHLALPGSFNRANALLAIAMLDRVGVPMPASIRAIGSVRVAGRLEPVGASGGASDIAGFVDYAHTPDAIGRVIAAARELAAGRIIVVVGAGGDRDAAKRPLMGAMAARLADRVIVTDDNPRSENPAAIRAAVLEGARGLSIGVHVLEIADRREAIVRAVQIAEPGDVVLVLGKGHEQGQEIAGEITPFDDRIELSRALSLRQAGEIT